MQFQSDICRASIVSSRVRETTALGAAHLAGITVNFWKNQEEVKARWRQGTVFTPQMDNGKREKLVSNWHKAVERSRSWAD